MPKPFEITVELEGRDPIIVKGIFNDHELKTMLLYLNQHEELTRSKPLREGFPCNVSIKAEKGSELRVVATLPDNDTVGLLLHRLRPFILQDMPANFITVSAIMGKCIDNPHLRQLLHRQRMLYDGRDFQQGVRLVSNKVVVNSDKVLCDWLNSHEYHFDSDKRETVDALFARMPGDLMRTIMISMLVDKVKAIQNVASLVAVLLGKSSQLQFTDREADAG